MKKPVYISHGLILLVAIWMLSGSFASTTDNSAVEQEGQQKSGEPKKRMKVRVKSLQASLTTRQVIIQGQLNPVRMLSLKAQTDSKVVEIFIKEGSRVKEGEVILKLDPQHRLAQLKQARAQVKTRQIELRAAKKLKRQGLQSENRVQAAEAALASAEADLERAEIELSYTEITAPFSGIFEQRSVEIGSQVVSGDKLALLIDESILKAVGLVSQQNAALLKIGQNITVSLLDGREVVATLSYISHLGDAQTHSFKVKAEIENFNQSLKAGISAELRIAVEEKMAHFLSPATLSLNRAGEVGIKAVNADGIVGFHSIEIMRSESKGLWVSGLPTELTVITQGHGYVSSGDQVDAVPES